MYKFVLSLRCSICSYFSFFFNDPATTEIYTLSLHDALPIYRPSARAVSATIGERGRFSAVCRWRRGIFHARRWLDRKSTRLNSSHSQISYAVFCLKKKKKKNIPMLKQPAKTLI